jgi:hypothetical protein
MDMDSEGIRAKGLIVAGILFLISSCFTWSEMYYLLFGKTTDATVTNVSEYTVRGRFGSNRGNKLSINYSFTEQDGTFRKGDDTVSTSFSGIYNNKVKVQYTSGENGSSRLYGNTKTGWLIIFAFSLLVLVGFGSWVAYASFANTRETPKKKKKTRDF